MSGGELYLGHQLQGVDDKGRVAIPSDFRSAFEANAAVREIFIARDRALGCLIASDLAWYKDNFERVDARHQAALDQGLEVDARQKPAMFGNPERAQFDANGRFILPGFSRSKARIDRWAFFHGGGRTFHIWAPEVLLASAHADEEARELCEYAMQQRKARA